MRQDYSEKSPADWTEALKAMVKQYKVQYSGEEAQELWNIIKSDCLMAQTYMVAERWARHTPHVWCYRYDGMDHKMAYHGWEVAPLFGNSCAGLSEAWTREMFEVSYFGAIAALWVE